MIVHSNLFLYFEIKKSKIFALGIKGAKTKLNKVVIVLESKKSLALFALKIKILHNKIKFLFHLSVSCSYFFMFR